jgi:hypothetical protein
VQPHVDAPPAEGDAFIFEPEPLLHTWMPAELDLAAGADYAMPRDCAMCGPQRPGDLPRVPGKSGRTRYLTISCDLTSWNPPHRRHEIAENERAARHTTGAAS